MQPVGIGTHAAALALLLAQGCLHDPYAVLTPENEDLPVPGLTGLWQVGGARDPQKLFITYGGEGRYRIDVHDTRSGTLKTEKHDNVYLVPIPGALRSYVAAVPRKAAGPRDRSPGRLLLAVELHTHTLRVLNQSDDIIVQAATTAGLRLPDRRQIPKSMQHEDVLRLFKGDRREQAGFGGRVLRAQGLVQGPRHRRRLACPSRRASGREGCARGARSARVHGRSRLSEACTARTRC